jgi:hypothetical protein
VVKWRSRDSLLSFTIFLLLSALMQWAFAFYGQKFLGFDLNQLTLILILAAFFTTLAAWFPTVRSIAQRFQRHSYGESFYYSSMILAGVEAITLFAPLIVLPTVAYYAPAGLGFSAALYNLLGIGTIGKLLLIETLTAGASIIIVTWAHFLE